MNSNETDRPAEPPAIAGDKQLECISPPATPPPASLLPPPPVADWEVNLNWARVKSFFSFGGANILYCLSALAILFGIAQIINPILTQSRIYFERLAGVLTLNLYECALLGVMLLIVLWRRVTDDAVSLLVLIALFLGANAVALDQVVVDNISMACVIGLACFALAVVKIWLMRRHIALRLDRLLLAGVLLLLAWNFLMSPAIALIKSLGCNNASSLRAIWQLGWLVMLGGGVLWYLQASATATGLTRSADAGRPFLQTAGMCWIFTGIILVISGLHQYELTYIFDLRSSFGDFIPLITLGFLIIPELMRIYGRESFRGRLEVVIAGAPLVLIGWALVNKTFIADSPWGIGFFWHPTVILALTAVAVLRAGLKESNRGLMYLVLAYGMLILLTAGVAYDGPASFHWRLTGGVLAAMLIGVGILRRDVRIAMVGIFIIALGCRTSPWIIQHLNDGWAQPGIFFGVLGLGIVGLSLILGEKMKKTAVRIGAVFLTIGVFFCFGDSSKLLLWAGLVLAILGLLVLRLRRDWLVSIILWIPVLTVGWKESRPVLESVFTAAINAVDAIIKAIGQILPAKISGWHYVILSFILLAAGMYLSLRKGRRRSENRSDAPSGEEHENNP